MARHCTATLWMALVAGPLLAQQHPVEMALGLASPASDLTSYAETGLLLELHLGRAQQPHHWSGRVRFQLASYQAQRVTEQDVATFSTYDRRTASFGAAFELLTPALGAGVPRLRGVFGLGPEAWRLTELETRRFKDGTTPDLRMDNGYGVYFGFQANLGLRLEFIPKAHAELRLEASKVAFVGVFEDRHFSAPVRLTATAGWRF